MTTGYYEHAKRLLLAGEVDLLGYPVRATLVDVGLHPILLSDDWVIGDVPPAARVATLTLANVQQRGGYVYADDLTFAAVGRPDDQRLVGMVLWVDKGDEGDSPLLCAWGGVAGGTYVDMWPLRLNGGDVVVLWGGEAILDVGQQEEIGVRAVRDEARRSDRLEFGDGVVVENGQSLVVVYEYGEAGFEAARARVVDEEE